MFKKLREKIHKRTYRRTLMVPLDDFIEYNADGNIVDKTSDIITAIANYKPRALFIYNRWSYNQVDTKKANMGGNGVEDMFRKKNIIEHVRYIDNGSTHYNSALNPSGKPSEDLELSKGVVVSAIANSIFSPNMSFQPKLDDVLILGGYAENECAKIFGMNYLPSNEFIAIMVPCTVCETRGVDCTKDLITDVPCSGNDNRRLKRAIKKYKEEK